VRYYEFEMKQIIDPKPGDNSGITTFLSIVDITNLIVNHQNSCDTVYQEAIENNFSHEYMTPLNPIMANSSLGKSKLINLYAEILKIKD
jgi:hypothetical protein